MQADEPLASVGRGWELRRATTGLALLIGMAAAWPGVIAFSGTQGAPQAAYSRLGYLVSFRFTQNSTLPAHGTNDQITVIFSSRTVEGTQPPRPFFDVDILQEFSFSGRDFQKDELQFTRRVRDRSFVDAAYIRVVNYGEDSWSGQRIWLTVDGEQILNGVAISPRTPGPSNDPFTNFNPENWRKRNYWEGSLQRLRPAKAR
jgi:hypothetical protein